MTSPSRVSALSLIPSEILKPIRLADHVLKRKLAQYEAPSVPENLVREKLFEIKFFETMPAYVGLVHS